MNYHEKQIIERGRELASLNPNNDALARARSWWREGRPVKYSHQDFDVLNSLTSAIFREQLKAGTVEVSLARREPVTSAHVIG